MRLTHAIPALPVRDQQIGAAYYRDRLGFTVAFEQEGFVKLVRDGVELHLWVADDERWRGRDGSTPVVSGAESFIAGTHSCRIGVEGVDELFESIRSLGGLDERRSRLQSTHFGTREFAVFDPDGNLVTFFERTATA